MTVRPSQSEDLPAITAIYRHYVLHSAATFEIDPPDVDEMTLRRAAIVAAGLPHLVALANEGTVLGYAYAGPYRPRPAYRFTLEDSIYIHPDHAGKGIGAALLGALIDTCRQGPWKQMIAVIGDSGNAASIALHRRLGFREAGILRAVGFKFDCWVDTVLMQREL